MLKTGSIVTKTHITEDDQPHRLTDPDDVSAVLRRASSMQLGGNGTTL